MNTPIHHLPSVSVIIPAYNRADTLAGAIDSVLAQKYPHFELIVVDDGSTDTTPEILRSYGETITPLHQANAGVSAARNLGIHNVKGEMIAFLDSDDYWLPDKISTQVKWFKENPTAMICQTEEIWIRHNRRVNPGKKHRKLSGEIFTPSLSLCLISPSAVMMKRVLIDQVGMFDPELPACEDYDLWLRVTCDFPVGLIDKPFVVRRGGHDNQLSAMPGLDKYRIHAIRKLLKSKALSMEQRAAAIKILKAKAVIYANGCEKRKRYAEADYYRKISLM